MSAERRQSELRGAEAQHCVTGKRGECGQLTLLEPQMPVSAMVGLLPGEPRRFEQGEIDAGRIARGAGADGLRGRFTRGRGKLLAGGIVERIDPVRELRVEGRASEIDGARSGDGDAEAQVFARAGARDEARRSGDEPLPPVGGLGNGGGFSLAGIEDARLLGRAAKAAGDRVAVAEG